MAEKARYGLAIASGNRTSTRFPLGLDTNGILHDAERFLAEYARRTGASYPGINLL